MDILKISRRAPRRNKPAFARVIMNSPELTQEQKALALYLLKIADENGVIKDPAINAMIDEAAQAVQGGASDGRH